MLIISEQHLLVADTLMWRGLSTPVMFAGQPGLLPRMESDPEKVYGSHSGSL